MHLVDCIGISIAARTWLHRSASGRSPRDISVQFITANGATLPALGFGTYGMPRSDMLRMIPAALNAGFRHFDTAQIYRNEAEIEECVAASGLKREDVFLTTKVWVANYPDRAFAASVDESLRKLRTDYVNLLLLHWPSDATPLAEQIVGLNAANTPARCATSASAISTGL
jgi:2,5-diketo-D-gluconate reductase B